MNQMNQMKKILIIDDEPSLLKILRKFLEKLEYSADTAENGELGIDLFQKAPLDYYGVILDYNLPGSSSADVLKKLKELNPEIKAVLSTGFSVEEISKNFNIKFDSTLQKPFTFAEFKNMITNL